MSVSLTPDSPTSKRAPSKPHYSISRVVIDAGHGGHDGGCVGSKTKEKDVALAIALKLGRYIEDHYQDVKVIYTRKTDVFVELHQRAEIANNAKADLFICIHCNSACFRDKRKKKEICSEETYGVETWVMGLHVADANLEVAKRENEVVLLEKDYTKRYDGFDPDSPEANIIFSLYQNTYLDQSLKLASLVENEVKKRGRDARGVKQAGFLVLYKTSMPGVLVETGFLTNPSEEKYLASSKGQDDMAHSIFNAFKAYKNSVESGEEEAVTPSSKGTVKESSQNDSGVLSTTPEADGTTVIIPTVKTDSTASIVLNPDSHSVNKKNNKTVKPVVVKKDITPVGIDKPLTDGVYYSVQILLSPIPLKATDAKFKGVKKINEEKDNNLFKYTVGRVKSLADASKLRLEMQGNGFKDAFIVTYKNGKRVVPAKTSQEKKKN